MTAQERPVSKSSNDAYRGNWEKIFGKKSDSDTTDSVAPDILPAEDSNTEN